MLWLKVWIPLALLMVILLVLIKADAEMLGMCFLAWCGGIVSMLMLQERYMQRDEKVQRVASDRDAD